MDVFLTVSQEIVITIDDIEDADGVSPQIIVSHDITADLPFMRFNDAQAHALAVAFTMATVARAKIKRGKTLNAIIADLRDMFHIGGYDAS